MAQWSFKYVKVQIDISKFQFYLLQPWEPMDPVDNIYWTTVKVNSTEV